MQDKLSDAIRVGKVSSIDPGKATATVTFEDRDGIVSRELSVIVPCTLNDKDYYMPAIGERVWVLFDPAAPSRGFIVGSFYADSRLPPDGDEKKRYTLFEDGTLVEYDKKGHKLTIRIPQGDLSVVVETAGDIKVDSKGKVQVEAAKTVEITSGEDITMTTKAQLNIVVAGDVSLTTQGNLSATIQGSADITAVGNASIKSQGHTEINGGCDVDVQAAGELNIKSAGKMTVESADELKLKGKSSEMIL